jgi:hypothetical protein
LANSLLDSTIKLIFDVASERTARRARIASLSIEDSIKRLYDGGMSKEDILSFIFDTETGRSQFITPISNAFGDVVSTNLQQIRHATRDAVYKENLPVGQLYQWTLVKDNNCEDCIARANEDPKTMEEWELVGVPQSGATICNEYCGCELTAV